MKSPTLSWERLAAAARRAPDGMPAPDARDWEASMARRALEHAATGQPSASAVLAEWITRFKVWIGVGLLIVSTSAILAPRLGAPSPSQRVDGWAADTLRQVKAWYPVSCEEAGEIGQMMRITVQKLQTIPSTDPRSHALKEEARRRIEAVLRPEEREAFEAEQLRLDRKWFGPR